MSVAAVISQFVCLGGVSTGTAITLHILLRASADVPSGAERQHQAQRCAGGQVGWGQDTALPPTMSMWVTGPDVDQPPWAPPACPLSMRRRMVSVGPGQRTAPAAPLDTCPGAAQLHTPATAGGAAPAAGEHRGPWRPLLSEPALSEEAPQGHCLPGACQAHMAPQS